MALPVIIELKRLLDDHAEFLSLDTKNFIQDEIDKRRIDPDLLECILRDLPLDAQQNKIVFIKWIRHRTLLGLKDAKDMAERLIAKW